MPERILTTFCIFEVIRHFGFKSADVVVGMIADFMARIQDTGNQFRIPEDVFAYQEKTGFGAEIIQTFQNPGGEEGNGSIVESDKNLICSIRDPEGKSLTKKPYNARYFSRGFQS